MKTRPEVAVVLAVRQKVFNVCEIICVTTRGLFTRDFWAKSADMARVSTESVVR